MKNLKTLRKKHRLSQKEIGKIFHASQNAVSQWESGARKPSYDVIQEIADYFNVTIDYLLGREEKPSENRENSALCNELEDLTQEERADILSYIRFKKSQREKTDYVTIAAKGQGVKKRFVSEKEQKQIAEALNDLSNNEDF